MAPACTCIYLTSKWSLRWTLLEKVSSSITWLNSLLSEKNTEIVEGKCGIHFRHTEGDLSGWFTVHWAITHPLLSLERFPRHTNQRGRMEQGGVRELSRAAHDPGKRMTQERRSHWGQQARTRDQLWTATSKPSKDFCQCLVTPLGVQWQPLTSSFPCR